MTRITDRIKASYKVIKVSTNGNGENLILEVEGKYFAVCVDSGSVRAYETFQESNGDWILLTASKTGKSLKTVDNFIQSRM